MRLVDLCCCPEKAVDSRVMVRSNPREIENDVTDPASASHAVDPPRLRATLRICFAPEQADALAARLVPDEIDAVGVLAPVLRIARLRFSTDCWLAPFKPSRATPPLHPRPVLSPVAALGLALHLGLDLDVATLARLFHKPAGEIAVELCRARQEVDPEHLSPCPDYASQIGRYRDPVSDRLLRLELLQHLEGCARCHLALEHARETDTSLLGYIEQSERSLTPTSATRSSRTTLWLGPTLFWGGIALLLLVLTIAGFAGSRRLLAGRETPVPLLSASAPAPRFDGWVLETTQAGEVQAFNVATGTRRVLVQGVATGSNSDRSVTVMLSPDHKRILQTVSSGSKSNTLDLRYFGVDGSPLNQLTLADEGSTTNVLDWLDDDHLLISEIPLRNQNESNEDYSTRLKSDGRLISYDLRTGIGRAIADGSYTAGKLSPDGKYVALLLDVASGQSQLELRAFDGTNVGEAVASESIGVPRPGGPSFIWTHDSGRVIFATSTSATQTTKFLSMALDGTVSTFYSLRNAGFTTLIGLTPDGQHLVYVASEGQINGSPWAYLQVGINGGEPQQLSAGGSPSTLTAFLVFREPIVLVASPDSDDMALTVQLPFSLPVNAHGDSSLSSNVVLAFNSDGQKVGALLEQFGDLAVLGWLPQNAIPPQPTSVATTDRGEFHEPANTVQGMDAASQLTADSQLSSDGSSVLIYDPIYGFSMSAAVNNGESGKPARQPFLETAGPPSEASWMPEGGGAIGVQNSPTSGGETSRVALYVGQTSDFGVTPTMVTFDPAGLGDNTAAAYHAPHMAPNGLHYSFFVSDETSVSLWIGGRDQPPKVVTSWSLPPNAKIDVPTITVWIDNTTLIVAEPDDWSSGLPQHITLQRVTLGVDGLSVIEPLTSWHARGNETGIALQELRLAPDLSRIAVRLRHFSGSDPNSNRVDSIEVLGADDLTQSLELARGQSGEGMSWSPVGSELVAVIQGGIKILSANGEYVQTVETHDDGQAAFPVWVLPNEIWYEEVVDEAARQGQCADAVS